MIYRNPSDITTPGWYWISDDSGDEWIVYVPNGKIDACAIADDLDDDNIMFAGPIKRPGRRLP
jgi:hypothetical protein